MPELPEVETVACGVNERVRGERIEAVWCGEKPESFRTPAAEMARELPGRRIGRVYRVGKYIVFDLWRDDAESRQPGTAAKVEAQWIVHLGMTGRLLVADPAAEMPLHTHAVLFLSSGRELRFVDPRRFGRISLHRINSESPGGGPFRGFGAEPLQVTPESFRKLFRDRRTPIKAALLNQRLLHGVGNIYADESLFRAGIRPRRAAGRLTARELDRLRESLQTVLQEAIRLGGSSVSDYVDASGARGFFQLQHRVYGRAGQPCRVCGALVRKVIVGGRGTHYCPACQR